MRDHLTIRAWREFRDLTQEQLAERTGLSEASISRIEAGKQRFSSKALETLAAALNVIPADLVNGIHPTSTKYKIATLVRAMSEAEAETALRVLNALPAPQRKQAGVAG